jgi:hypothetical protein
MAAAFSVANGCFFFFSYSDGLCRHLKLALLRWPMLKPEASLTALAAAAPEAGPAALAYVGT